MWRLRPTKEGEARPGPFWLFAGLFSLASPMLIPELFSASGSSRSLVMGGIGLFAVVSLLHWWRARVIVEGAVLSRNDFLGRETFRARVKWASVEERPRMRLIHCTLDDDRLVSLDGEWANADGLFRALCTAGVASDTWPQRPLDEFRKWLPF